MSDDPKIEITDRDLMAGYNESKLDRVGKPIDVEHHAAGKPEEAETETAKSSHTLIDMSEDYEFFTTGVIHATTVFDRDPIQEFNKLHPTELNEELPVAIDYASSFFNGLGISLVAGTPINLDRRLYGILRHRWPLLRDVIAGIAMIHRPTNFYARTNFYEMDIVDPFALKKLTIVEDLPTVTITVFGVSSNKQFSYLASRAYPGLPELVNEKPKPDILTTAKQVLGPPPSPESLMPKRKQT